MQYPVEEEEISHSQISPLQYTHMELTDEVDMSEKARYFTSKDDSPYPKVANTDCREVINTMSFRNLCSDSWD